MAGMTVPEALDVARRHLQAGRLADVEAACRAIVAAAPWEAEAYRLLGAAAYYGGKPGEAEAFLRHALELNPAEAEYHDNLGVMLHAWGRLAEAEAEERHALALRPDFADAAIHLGNTLQAQGRLEEAALAFEHALAVRPGSFEAESNRANVLLGLGRPAEAEAAARRALALQPVHAKAEFNLGVALGLQARLDEAEAAFRRALAADPRLAEAEIHLGIVLAALDRRDEAVAAYRRALAIEPTCVEAENNLAGVLESLNRLDEAEAAARRALAIEPDRAVAACTLASILQAQGRLEEAVAMYRRALDHDLDVAFAHSKALFCEQYHPGVTLAGLAESHARWDRRHAAPLHATWRPHAGTRDPDRPLRLGFVSNDFGRHPVGYFLVRTLEALAGDRSCETFGYSDRIVVDDLTRRIAAACGTWRETRPLTDEALAEQVRADRIDVLVDLAGHTGHRLLVFARKPAPLQATWIGYVGTTGMAAMDVLIADRFHVPPGSDAHYCERVIRLPDGYVCYDPPADAPDVGPSPALGHGYVTFGCFNNSAKIHPEVVALWAEILRRVPRSRLILRSRWLDDARTREQYRAWFAARGADPTRLEFAGHAPQAELMAAYNRVDVALDPFPYSGGLTTCEALWMGVLVLTCPGETFASRHSLSHLSNVGLGDLVAGSREEYLARAVEWAGRPDWLAELRGRLRRQVTESPLCDGERLAANLMTALRGLWREWCAAGRRGEIPQGP
jgi:predicted O-linked N-acetylglucosamine transferase (SPINDLY family)